jgi:hypothetical protein
MGEEQTPPAAPERRRETRRPCAPGRELVMLALPGPEFLWGRAVNASAQGVALLLGRALPVGVAASLLNTRAPPGTRLVSRVRVARVDAWPHGDGWLVGCEFLEPLTEVEVRSFVPDPGGRKDAGPRLNGSR